MQITNIRAKEPIKMSQKELPEEFMSVLNV